MSERFENLLVEIALAEWRLRDAQQNTKPDPWKRGYIAPSMSNSAAVMANCAITKMIEEANRGRN